MDHMDNLHERVEALEQHTRRVERRLRWWRGIACGVVVLGLLGLAVPSGKAQEERSAKGGKSLAQRLEALEYKLAHITSGPDDVTITGANLRIVNGLGSTDSTNGVGNLIIGYNESRVDFGGTDDRTGSHNLVVGRQNNFSRFGGLVVGVQNEISGEFASVLAGSFNIASGVGSSVSGGNTNTATGFTASVGGGGQNTASGELSSVSGGNANQATDFYASVSGGGGNTASGILSSVSGGKNRSAPARDNWAAGPLFADF